MKPRSLAPGRSRRGPRRSTAISGVHPLVRRGVLAGAAAATLSCSAGPDAEREQEQGAGGNSDVAADDSLALGTSAAALSTDGAVCVSIRRGTLGTVRDATLWQNAAGWNDSTSPNLSTGSVASAGARRSLVRFDLSSVPTGATVTSATLSLHQTYKVDSSTIGVYRVTAPWEERTVTWRSLGDSGFDAESVATIAAEAGVGARAADVSSLVQSWVLGTAQNHGVLLDEASSHSTGLRSSEIESVEQRPRLDVCYVTCSDGRMNGLEAGIDCGGPHCAPCVGATTGASSTASAASSSAATSSSSAATSSSTGASSSAGDPCADPAALPPDPTPPARLSETGLYVDIATRSRAANTLEYRPAYELWSDGASKRRFVYLPRCSTIDTSDMDHWSLPVGTRFWKEFRAEGVAVETRLIHRFGPGIDDWVFAAYAWDPTRNDAFLVEDGVEDARGTSHDIPRTADCWECHGKLPERILGFSALQLSHDGSGETITSLSNAGWLTVPMPRGFRPPGDAKAAAALGYLHANCGNCHNSTGVATLRTRLLAANTTVESTDTYATGVGVTPSFWEPGVVHRITAGDPDSSAVVRRMAHRGTRTQMPPIGSEVVDAAGVAAVRAWIEGVRPPAGAGGSGAASGSASASSAGVGASSASAGASSASATTTTASVGAGGASPDAGSAGTGAGGGVPVSGSSSAGSGSAGAACTGVPRLKLTPVASGLSTPLFLTSPPGDTSRMFVLEKDGVVRLIKDGVLRSTPFLDIRGGTSCPPSRPASANPLVCTPSPTAEGGLLGMAFHPNYASNGRFWLFYTAAPRGNVTIAEFRRSAANPDVADTSAASMPVRKLLDTKHGGWNHAGGTLAFGPDGYLYASVGDSAVTPYSTSPAKDLASPLGKILRIDVDTGLGPSGNLSGAGVNPLVWDYGLRNPWRISFDRRTGDLYIADVGQNAWEELNIEPARAGRRNYGWPTMEGDHCVSSGCSRVGVAPAVEHSHSSGEGGSITGGHVYRGSAIPCLQGRYVYGDYGTHRFWTLRWDGSRVRDHVEITADLASSLPAASFGEDAAGELYVVMLTGEVFRIDPR
ncbi:PQQ-dependent sugar dehydrogenase [Sorangium sp. So ce1389]|uniref:PQQ-dependent sugar dehydrogenase n=1 Tax=Sorangium sp. So ce1389 TaxID=3133336 RepID=UPI003F5F02FF